MISANRRYCDVCDVRIFDEEPYYTGVAPKKAIHDLIANPQGAPSYTPLPDGSILFELCRCCVADAPDLVEHLHLEAVLSR